MSFRLYGTNWAGQAWRVAGSIKTIASQIDEIRAGATHPADGTVASKTHDQVSPTSDHSPDAAGIVRAIDFGETTPGLVDEIGEQLRTSEDPRIRYFIHDTRMFSSYPAGGIPPWTWRPYTGANPHRDHGHLSVLEGSLEDDMTPFAIGDADMALNEDDIRKIWEYPVPDEDDGLGTRGAVHALRQAWGFSRQAAIDAKIARQLAEKAATGTTLTPTQIEAIADAVSAEVADDVADELAGRLEG